MVAASDYPGEFWSRRDQLVEKLITALLPQCFGCGDAVDGEESDSNVKRDDVGKQSNDNDDDDGPEKFPGCLRNLHFLDAFDVARLLLRLADNLVENLLGDFQ